MQLATTRVEWHPAFRIVPTRFPTISLFDRVASPEDFEALYELEALTNDRIRNEVGDVNFVPKEERLYDPGSGPIMAAFTHLNPLGSRFSDGAFGVFYAAREKETAIAETQYHQGNFLRATKEAALQLQMRLYHVEVAAKLHDLRRLRAARPELYDPNSYLHSQALGRELHAAVSAGVVYQSVRCVRRAKGECIGAFKPRALANCRHAAHLLYQWDGAAFTGVFEQIG